MKVSLVLVGFGLILFSLFFVQPPGFQYYVEASSHVQPELVEFMVPDHLVKLGYPLKVSVSRSYFLDKWRLDAGDFKEAVFRNNTIYDPSCDKFLSPEEAKTHYIGECYDVVETGNGRIEVAWPKLGTSLLGFLLFFTGLFVSGGEEVGKVRKRGVISGEEYAGF